jgi:glutaredoxin
MNKAVVWSKPNCPNCVKAKTLLEIGGIDYTENKIGVDYTKEQLLKVVPLARSVPQIFLNGEYIGGYEELKVKISSMNKVG